MMKCYVVGGGFVVLWVVGLVCLGRILIWLLLLSGWLSVVGVLFMYSWLILVCGMLSVLIVCLIVVLWVYVCVNVWLCCGCVRKVFSLL